jgi:hypothetical protein
MRFQYPLKLSFKLIALAPQIYIRDAAGNDLFYVRQKMFKLKEDIGVYSDQSKSQQLFNIKADRIIDFSAQYNFTSTFDGRPWGAIKRKGMRSLWSAHYLLFDPAGNNTHYIKEADPWVKVADGCFSGIPLLGAFSGYVFHPSYIVHQVGTDMPVMKLTKQPAFFEGVFSVEPLVSGIPDEEEARFLLGYMMLLLLERQRG